MVGPLQTSLSVLASEGSLNVTRHSYVLGTRLKLVRIAKNYGRW